MTSWLAETSRPRTTCSTWKRRRTNSVTTSSGKPQTCTTLTIYLQSKTVSEYMVRIARMRRACRFYLDSLASTLPKGEFMSPFLAVEQGKRAIVDHFAAAQLPPTGLLAYGAVTISGPLYLLTFYFYSRTFSTKCTLSLLYILHN